MIAHSFLLCTALLAPQDGGSAAPTLGARDFEDFRWRCIGPTAMGGRIVDLATDPSNPSVFYLGSATGGLFKTTNNGTTFEPVFENEGSSSVGAVAVSEADPQVVWVGTGEANARNSVSWGDGVYSSEDGGESWTHRGLSGTRHVGGIAIDPRSSSTVFVAAMGRTWGPNEERGLYRTRDGGQSWERVLYVDDGTGCIDVRIDPSEPDIVYAATYERQRDEFDSNDPMKRTGPGSGLWRSTDGGETFQRLENGLPTVNIGRIGLDLYAKDPRTLFAIIETERTGERGAAPRDEERVSLGIRGTDGEEGGFVVSSVTSGESAAQAGIEEGDVLTRIENTDIGGRADLVQALAGYAPGDSAAVVYLREGVEGTTTLELLGRLQRGEVRSFAGSQGGQIANAQGEQGSDGYQTGGLFRSDDRGTTWRRINSINPRPFYYSQVRVDPSDDQKLWVLGIQLHRSTDGGEEFDTIGGSNVGGSIHPDHHSMWIDPRDGQHVILGNDGGCYVSWDLGESWDHLKHIPMAQFYNIAVDMRDPYWVYGGLQDNGSWGGPSQTRGRGIAVDDWITIGGGDGFRCAVDPRDPDIVYSESQNGAIGWRNVRTGEQGRVSRPGGGRGGGGSRTRFNWNTPYFLSPHNASILFFAGNEVYRSIDGGERTQTISEEITRTDRGSATALAQSPLDEDQLWVGTDDGAFFMTHDGGDEWTSIADRLPGLAGPRYVSDIEPSPHDRDTVFVVCDGHRSDDESPHVFVSTDAGESFRRITEGLPEVPARTIAVDPVNDRLLFLGTEFGCFVSLDRGARWTAFDATLPTVPVHDLVIHPRDADLVAGTHGRGIWIVDIRPLQGLDEDALAGPALLPVSAVRRWNRPPEATLSGQRRFLGENPPSGASIYYYLPEDQEDEVRLVVKDVTGQELRSLEGPGDAGLHRVDWDLRSGGRNQRGRGGRGGFGGGRGGSAEPGDYSVTLELGERPPVRKITILGDPSERAAASAPVPDQD